MPEQPQDQPLPTKKAITSKKRPTKRLVMSIVGIVVVCVIATGVVGYLLWLNSPAHVLAQSFKNTLALDKTTYQLTYTDEAGKNASGLSSAKIDGQYARAKGSRATASLIFKNNAYSLAIDTDLALDTTGVAYYQYKKVGNVPGGDPKNQMSDELLKQVLTAFGSRWSRLDSNTLQSGSACIIAATQKMQNDTDLGKKFVDSLFGSGAVTVGTTSSQADTTVYSLKGKADKANAFVDAYTKTDVYEDLIKCDDSSYKVTADSIKDALSQSEVTVTVNKKAQRIEKLVFTRKQDAGTTTLQFTVTPADKVDVTIPTNVTDVQ